MEFWILQILNAVQYSMLLFLLSVGLSIILGLLHFVNLAHGAFYMLGAYIGISITEYVQSFFLALFLAPIIVMIVGACVYFFVIYRVRQSDHTSQVLVTFGITFIFVDIIRVFWGDIALGLHAPMLLQHPVSLFGVHYPSYRLFIIVMGLVIMLSLWCILSYTKIGAIIRASVENETMAKLLGIDVQRLFFWMFCLGCALAGFAGVIAAPVLSATPDMGISILIPTLIVVVVGGMGSLQGAVVGSFVVGTIETFGAAFLPELSAILMYLLLAVMLIFRPQGCIPARS